MPRRTATAIQGQRACHMVFVTAAVFVAGTGAVVCKWVEQIGGAQQACMMEDAQGSGVGGGSVGDVPA